MTGIADREGVRTGMVDTDRTQGPKSGVAGRWDGPPFVTCGGGRAWSLAIIISRPPR